MPNPGSIIHICSKVLLGDLLAVESLGEAPKLSLERSGIGKAAWKGSLERQLGKADWKGSVERQLGKFQYFETAEVPLGANINYAYWIGQHTFAENIACHPFNPCLI